MKRIILITALLLSACDSYELEMERLERYCDMVRAQAWPEFDQSINCEKDL